VPTKGRQAAQARYNSKPEQVKRRTARNAARRAMIRAGKARKGDGKDVGHRNGNPLDNRKGNLRMESKASNRSLKRKRDGSKRDPRD
jgi:hypothetical protein